MLWLGLQSWIDLNRCGSGVGFVLVFTSFKFLSKLLGKIKAVQLSSIDKKRMENRTLPLLSLTTPGMCKH